MTTASKRLDAAQYPRPGLSRRHADVCRAGSDDASQPRRTVELADLLNAGINSRRHDRPSRPTPPLPAKPAQTHGLGYAESLTKQVGMTGALGDPDDTELVDMSARYRAISQRPISTNSAIRRSMLTAKAELRMPRAGQE